MKNIDIEKLNRDNFKALMNALSLPGTINKIEPLFESALLAIANTLLYSQTSFYYKGLEEFTLIEAITNSKSEDKSNCDYLFADNICKNLLENSKIGTIKDPEFSTTHIFKCKNFKGLNVRLSGPGVEGAKEISLPVDMEFLEILKKKNSLFPLGNEIFFLSEELEVLALSRTTKIEVL